MVIAATIKLDGLSVEQQSPFTVADNGSDAEADRGAVRAVLCLKTRI